jgi:hypothetical protein
MTEVSSDQCSAAAATSETDKFNSLSLTGRRNALPNVLDENVTKMSSKKLVEKLVRLRSTDQPDDSQSANTDTNASVNHSNCSAAAVDAGATSTNSSETKDKMS